MSDRKNLSELTNREREVLDLLRLELTNEQIAERMGISQNGVKYHVSLSSATRLTWPGRATW